MRNTIHCSYLLIIVVLSTLSSYGQNHLKGSGEVFYHNTFDWGDSSHPRGWRAEEGFVFEDPLDKGFNWHWYPNDSLISRYVKEPPFRSSSAEDGHLCLFLDRYTQEFSIDADTAYRIVNNAILFPTVDCSQHSSVIVSYETNFLAWPSGGMEMYVSNNGIHWAKWELGFGVDQLERPQDIEPGGVALFEANISEVAAGMPNVQIKIYWWNCMRYYWLIDDFKLSEAYDYDMRGLYHTLEWVDDNEYRAESFTSNFPKSQLGSSFKNFEMGYVNFGEFTLDNVFLEVDITKNHQSIWNKTSYPISVPPSAMESFIIEDEFFPTEFGHYMISYEIKHDKDDHTPDDNKATLMFNVTDSIYSRCDNTMEKSYSYGYLDPGMEGETNEQVFIGTTFPIYGDTKIQGVSVYITGGLADGEILIRGALYNVIEEQVFGGTLPWMFSNIVELDSSMFNTWVYFPFEPDGGSEFLKAGEKYYAGLEYWNYHTEVYPYKKHMNVEIGLDQGVKLQFRNPICVTTNATIDWRRGFALHLGDTRNPMVRMILDDHSNLIDGTDQNTAKFAVKQNYPNPADRISSVEYELGYPSSVQFEIVDLTGKTILTIDEGTKPAGKHVIQLDLTEFSAGIYFYTLAAGVYSDTKQMIVK